MMTSAEFVISRPPVQAWSPAPFRINHLQTTVGSAISSAVGTFVRTARVFGRLAVYLSVVSVTLMASPAIAQDRSSLVLPSVVLVGAQAADLHSTHLVLSRGGVERNPVMRHPFGTQAAIKTVATAAILGGAHLVHKRHPRWAKTLVWAASTAALAASAVNYRNADRLARR